MGYLKKYPGMKKNTRDGRKEYERLTKKEIELIRRMLLGPFKKEWYNCEGLVVNTDRAISERMDLPFSLVSQCTQKILNDKEDNRLLMREFLECKSCNNSFKTCKKHFNVLKKLVK